MVLDISDIKHLGLMQKLAEKEPLLIIEKPKPTNLSLDENILRLCDKLEVSGFITYAANIRNQYLTIKAADVHLYRAHDEDGEDLIEFAHPDGDHNVEDGELGDVETIVSKHNKIKKIVEKEPNGKLAKYVEMCRVVLADGEQKKTPKEQLAQYLNWIRERITSVEKVIDRAGDLSWFGQKPAYLYYIHELKSKIMYNNNPSPADANDAIDYVNDLIGIAKGNDHGFGSLNPYSGVDKSVRNNVISNLQAIADELRKVYDVAVVLINIELPEPVGPTPYASSYTANTPNNSLELEPDILEQYKQSLNKRLSDLKTKLMQTPASKNPAWINFFEAEAKDIENIKTQQDYDKEKSNMDTAEKGQ